MKRNLIVGQEELKYLSLSSGTITKEVVLIGNDDKTLQRRILHFSHNNSNQQLSDQLQFKFKMCSTKTKIRFNKKQRFGDTIADESCCNKRKDDRHTNG